MFRFVQTGKWNKNGKIHWKRYGNERIQISIFSFSHLHTVFSRTSVLLSQNVAASQHILRNVGLERGFGTLCKVSAQPLYAFNGNKYFIAPQITQSIVSKLPIECVPNRMVTKFGANKGKRHTMKPVIKRFFRLHWGGWIRTRCGRHKKMWKKRSNRKHRLRQHVFVNAQQSWLLDKMVTKFWKRPKHYIDDIYEPYHERSFYLARNKPLPYPSKPLTKHIPPRELSKIV